jgi:hypothetical protein
MPPTHRTIVSGILICGTAVLGFDDPETAARDAHRAKMKQVAESIQLTDAESRQPLRLAADPVLRYTDATRKQHESALWIWGAPGRPAAIMAIEFYPAHMLGPQWLYEIASLADRRISARHESGLNWSATQPGLSLAELPDAGLPADQPARRLSRMKQLLRRFAAHETATIEGRIELRPLANPLHRYADPDSSLIDGAIFAFANGTNPEVFVLIEAHAVSGGPAVWKYSLAQMTGEKVSVSVDGREVWTRDLAEPPAARDTYLNGWLRAQPE